MIHAHHLTKSFRAVKALTNVSLTVAPGEIYGILGPNGAGKSTLFKILCGLLSQDSGTCSINSSKPKPIGAIIEKPALFEYLSAYENLFILSKIQGASIDMLSINKKLESVGLPLDRKDPVRHFSLGMKQRLGIAIALLNDPDCLILDEPFLGMDPVGMHSLRILIKKLATEHQMAILVSSHLLDELSRLCEKLLVIRSGEIVNSGLVADILADSTEKFMVCGSNLEKSNILKNHMVEVEGDCIAVKLKVAEAPNLLRSLIEEGMEINFFGPEKNIDKLYQGK